MLRGSGTSAVGRARFRGPREQPAGPPRARPHVPRWLRGPPWLPRRPASPQRSILAADGTWPGPILSCRSLSSQLPISAPRCGSPARWGRRRRGAPSGRIVVGASRGGISGHPGHRSGARGRKRAGLLSGRGGAAGAGLAGACVSLALCCSERPRLRRNRRRGVSKARALRLEVGRAQWSG